MVRYLRLGAVYMRMHLKRLWMFRASFLMNFISQGLNYAVTFLLMWVMITAFGTMNGWSPYEVMLLYAVNLTAYGFAGMFFYFLRYNVLRDIKNGAFDDVFTKPLRPLPYLIIQNQHPAYITHLTLAIIMLVVCISNLGLQLGILQILHLMLIVVCGVFIFGGMFLFITAPAFFITEASSLGEALFFFRETSYYPLSIFPKFMQILMTVILPYGMINFFPIQPLLGKNDFLMFGPWIAYLAPLFAAAFFALAALFFSFSARHYKSTGS